MVREVYLVARRELQLKVKSKVIVISFAILLVIAGMSPWIARLGNSNELKFEVTYSGFSPKEIEEVIANERIIDALEKIDFKFARVQTAREGKQAVKAAKSDLFINKTDSGIDIYTDTGLRQEPIVNLKSLFSQLALQRYLIDAGISSQELNTYLFLNEPRVILLDEGDESIDIEVSLFALVLLYMIISLSGGFLALTIIEEKSGRVIEVLLSSISPRQLLLGKILGVLIFSLTQFTIVVATWLVSSQMASSSALKGISTSQLVFYLLWFLPAVISYSFIYGGLGALISRSEDSGAIQGPISMLLISSVYGATYSLSNPSASFVDFAIYIPPFSFFVAPAQYLLTRELTFQLVVGYCLALLFTGMTVRLALVLFERNVLNNHRITFKSMRSVSRERMQ
jgi:ABC-2 type transport system permease protein